MIEEIALGIFGLAVGVAAYLSARKMTLGHVYYYGQTLSARTHGSKFRPKMDLEAIEAQILGAPETAAIEILSRYLQANQNELIVRSELIRLMAIISQPDQVKRYLRAKYQSALEPTLLRLEIATAAETRKIQASALHAEESQEHRIDELERRVRALEKKSSLEAVETSESSSAEVSYVQ